MPTLLKHDTIRMLEASVNFLELSIGNLSHTNRVSFKQPAAAFAPEIGLIGTSVELAMSACLIQTYGIQVIKLDSGMYKTGQWILDDFIQILKSPPKKADFLIDGISDAQKHLDSLLITARNFRLLISCRAAGFHAGKGVSFEVVLYKAKEASQFLDLLRKSTRLAPYIQFIPEIIGLPPDRKMIIEDLYSRVNSSRSDNKVEDIISLFLVLPEISNAMPEWLESIERVQVAPRNSDINFLITTLDNAVPVGLRRIRDGKPQESLSYRFAPEDQNAIPIQTQFTKKQFSMTHETYHAYVGIANGAIEKGNVTIPSADEIRALFVEGIEQSGILMGKKGLTAHESWMMIASSIITQGTRAPFWFIVRKVLDIPQLIALLSKAEKLIRRTQSPKLLKIIHEINEYSVNGSCLRTNEDIKEILENIEYTEKAKKRLLNAIRDPIIMTPVEILEIKEFVHNSDIIGIYKKFVENNKLQLDSTLARIFVDSSMEYEDVEMIQEIALNFGNTVSTNIKKAYRRIDFVTFGPSVIA